MIFNNDNVGGLNTQVVAPFTTTKFGNLAYQGSVLETSIPFNTSARMSGIMGEKAIPGIAIYLSGGTTLDAQSSISSGNATFAVPVDDTVSIAGFLLMYNETNIPAQVPGTNLIASPFINNKAQATISTIGSGEVVALRQNPAETINPGNAIYWDTTANWITKTATAGVTIALSSVYQAAIPIGRGIAFTFNSASQYYVLNDAVPLCFIKL